MKTRQLAAMLLGSLVAVPTVVAEPSETELAELRNMVSGLVSTMVERGVLTQEGAEQLLNQARVAGSDASNPASASMPLEKAAIMQTVEDVKREREALEFDLAKLMEERKRVAEQLEQAAVEKELIQNRQRKAIEAEVKRQVEEALAAQARQAKEDVRVRYVPDFVIADIREQVKSELKEEVKTEVVQGVYEDQGEEGLPIPEVPEWAGRIKLGGDVRLRYQHDNIADDSGKWYDYQEINDNGGFDTTDDPDGDLLARKNMERDRLRGRLRLGIDAKLGYDFKAGARISTGNTGDPVSTNQTLATGFNRYEVVLDRAFLGYSWKSDMGQWRVDASGGRIENPFYSTDLLWDSDLGFEGVAASLAYKNDRPQRLLGVGTRGHQVKATLGAFPLEEYAFTSRDKWLFGGQLEAEATLLDRKKLHFGVGYYTYDNITGVADDRGPGQTSRDALVDASVPRSMQKGNTLYDLYNAGNFAPGSTQPDVFGLAADYGILNLSAGIEIPDFSPYNIWLTADYVKNLGYDSGEVRDRVDGARTSNPISGKHDTGYMFRAEVGSPWLLDEGDWRLYGAYKYIEPDAVLDAFNDSDFLLGGTNAKGFIIGGKYVLQRDVVLAFRYLNAESIMNPLDASPIGGGAELDPLKSSTYQLEINGRF
jgi:hypothetical protein